MQLQLSLKNEEYLTAQKDSYSTSFELQNSHEERKVFAQFFTHKNLVNFILSKLDLKPNSYVLDPACGAGAFLSQVQKYTNVQNIYGIDIDNIAADLCFQNLNGFCSNIVVGNTLKNFEIEKTFPIINKNGGFDFIVGNPPFQNLKKNIDYDSNNKIYKQVTNGIANSATLMIAKSLELLKNNGYLAFILPKNILRVDSFTKLRSYLLKNTTIVSITDIGHFFKDVRGDQIIMIIKIEFLTKNAPLQNLTHYHIKQNIFNDFEIFPVFYKKDLFSIYNKFKNIKTTLCDICTNDIFRGISLNFEEYSLNEDYFENSIKIYRGASIERFGIKKCFYINNNVLKLKNIERLQQEKIILQNLCSKEGGIFATLSTNEELNIDTVTNVIPKTLNTRYILGILNSKIANIFIIYLIFLHSNFTMHTDKTYIGQLPIAIPSMQQEKIIIKLVDKLLSINDKYSNEFFEVYNEMNDILYDIYCFNEKERDVINSILKEGMSKKQN